MARGDLILTVLAARLTADIQSQIDALIVQFGLQEKSNRRLADLSLQQNSLQQGKCIDCIEHRLVGEVDVEAVLNAARVLSETLSVDIVIQARFSRSRSAPFGLFRYGLHADQSRSD